MAAQPASKGSKLSLLKLEACLVCFSRFTGYRYLLADAK